MVRGVGKNLEWREGHPPTRFTDDRVKAKGSRWMAATFNKGNSMFMEGEGLCSTERPMTDIKMMIRLKVKLNWILLYLINNKVVILFINNFESEYLHITLGLSIVSPTYVL